MAYAIVRTVRPKAKETPAKPIPSSGNAAASTALPHPPNTNQNVPTNSAVRRCVILILHLLKSKSEYGRPRHVAPDAAAGGFMLTEIAATDSIARAFGHLATRAVLHTRTDGQLACRENRSRCRRALCPRSRRPEPLIRSTVTSLFRPALRMAAGWNRRRPTRSFRPVLRLVDRYQRARANGCTRDACVEDVPGCLRRPTDRSPAISTTSPMVSRRERTNGKAPSIKR